jgi:hypothetical protein
MIQTSLVRMVATASGSPPMSIVPRNFAEERRYRTTSKQIRKSYAFAANALHAIACKMYN